jgi:hypothetical protein
MTVVGKPPRNSAGLNLQRQPDKKKVKDWKGIKGRKLWRRPRLKVGCKAKKRDQTYL